MAGYTFRNTDPLFLLPVLSGTLVLLSFPPFNQGYLAWISLVPLLFYSRKVNTAEKAFTGGLFAGVIFFLYLYSYMAISVNFLFPDFLGILVVIIASLYSALYFGGFTLFLFFLLKRGHPLFMALAAPSLWVLLEYLRSAGLLGHSGGFLGYSQAGYPFLLPLVSVYGYWGLPFCMILFQIAVFFVLTPKLRKKNALPGLLWPFVLLSIILLVGFSVPSLFPIKEKDNALRIALLQGNIPQENILTPNMAAQNFQQYLKLTEEVSQRFGSLDLIVWPETVLSLNVTKYHPDATAELVLLAAKTDAPLLIGAMVEDKDSKSVYNSILMLQPGQSDFDAQRYDKQRLVPFAEYFPFHNLLNSILKSNVSLGTYTPGRDASPFYLGNSIIGGIVCFESYFSRPALHLARKHAEHIFILTNDAWFLESHGVQQHADAAPFRAAELGLGVTQVANTGFTRSYNYRGELILELPPFQEGSALLETKMPHRETLYRLWGDYFVLVCSIVFVFSLIQTRSRRSNPEK